MILVLGQRDGRQRHLDKDGKERQQGRAVKQLSRGH